MAILTLIGLALRAPGPSQTAQEPRRAAILVGVVSESQVPFPVAAAPPVVEVPTPPPPQATILSGTASWYCNSDRSRGPISRCMRGHPGGLYAAIRRDLLSMRGDVVNVCSSAACVRVRIVDCNCGRNANLIDLYADAFERIAPLSAGRVHVTIQGGPAATVPPTDEEGP